MKKVLLVTALVLAMAGAAFAANTSNVSVSANIVGACQVTTGAATLGFGALDAASMVGNATAASAISFWCTKGTAFTTTPITGTARTLTSGTTTDTMAYTITHSATAATGAGKNTPITLNLSGTITEAVWTNVTPAAYTDSFVITIAP